MLDKSSLKLESLYKEFDVNMIKYDQEYKNYLNILHNNKTNYINLEGKTYWGGYALKEGATNTLQECQAMCSNDTKCSGATYKGKSKYCWTRGGEGMLIASSSNKDYAIVTEIYQSASILYSLNIIILDIIQNIKKINKQNEKQDEQIDLDKSTNNTKLNEKYNLLLQQNKEIEEILQNYKTLEEGKSDTTLKVNQYFFNYKIYFILVILLVYIIIKIIFNIPYNFSVLYLVICFFVFILEMRLLCVILLFVYAIYKILS